MAPATYTEKDNSIFLDTPTKPGKAESYLPLYTTSSPSPPLSPPRYGPREEEDEESATEEPRLRPLRVLSILLVLLTTWYLVRRTGPTTIDMHVLWDVQGVSKEAKARGEVPWWKLAVVTLKVDVDVTSGGRRADAVPLPDGHPPMQLEYDEALLMQPMEDAEEMFDREVEGFTAMEEPMPSWISELPDANESSEERPSFVLQGP